MEWIHFGFLKYMILFTISTSHGLEYSSEVTLQSRNGLLYFVLQGLWDHTFFFFFFVRARSIFGCRQRWHSSHPLFLLLTTDVLRTKVKNYPCLLLADTSPPLLCSSPPDRLFLSGRFFHFTLICELHLIQPAILFPFHSNTWITSYFCTDVCRGITATKRWQTPEQKNHGLAKSIWKQEAQYPNLAIDCHSL